MPVQMPDWLRKWLSNVIVVLDGLHKKVTADLAALRSGRKGTKLAIVGPPASGKTVVHVFLGTGVLITEYVQTQGAVKYDRATLELEAVQRYNENPIKLSLSDRIDVSGDYRTHSYAWKNALNDAFLVLFMFDMSQFVADSHAGAVYRRTVIDGCDFAGGLIANSDTKVILVGTHCDLIPGWNPTSKGSNEVSRLFWGDYTTDANDARTHLARNTVKDAEVVWGSLKDQECAESLLYDTFVQAS
jgi:hypothetical protein